MKYRFHHFHIICSNLDEMENFFKEVLGAKFLKRLRFGTADGSLLDLDGVSIYLRVPREDENIAGDASLKSYGYDHLGLEVEDLDVVYSELKEKGYVFTMPPTETKDAKIAFFNGPDNINIELFQPV